MLLRLADRPHQVVSAVAVLHGARLETVVATTEVVFGEVDERDARRYADSGEPLDKAGAYGIQGYAARWVRAIHGSYTNVVGLPLYETAELLVRFGVHASRLAPGLAPVGTLRIGARQDIAESAQGFDPDASRLAS